MAPFVAKGNGTHITHNKSTPFLATPVRAARTLMRVRVCACMRAPSLGQHTGSLPDYMELGKQKMQVVRREQMQGMEPRDGWCSPLVALGEKVVPSGDLGETVLPSRCAMKTVPPSGHTDSTLLSQVKAHCRLR